MCNVCSLHAHTWSELAWLQYDFDISITVSKTDLSVTFSCDETLCICDCFSSTGQSCEGPQAQNNQKERNDNSTLDRQKKLIMKNLVYYKRIMYPSIKIHS